MQNLGKYSILKKLGIFVCFAIVIVIIFAGGTDKLLARRQVSGTDCEGSFVADSILYQSPLSSYLYDAEQMSKSDKQFKITDDIFEMPDFGVLKCKIEKPVYEYCKDAFEVVNGKTYVVLNDPVSDYDIDVSAYLTRIALKVFDKNGNDTGYVVYKFIDADKQAHIFVAAFYDGSAQVMIGLKAI